jgi:hypothetical protein
MICSVGYKCAHCSAVIGTYEPLIVDEGERVRRTSRTAEGDLRGAVAIYHEECWISVREAALRGGAAAAC